MKTAIAGLFVFFAASAAQAGCVGVSSEYTQICSMVTDKAQCAQLAGVCTWKDGSSTEVCSGEQMICGMILDKQQCTEVGCNWH